MAVTREGQTARQLHLYRGVIPILYNKPVHDVWAEDVDQRVAFALELGKETTGVLLPCVTLTKKHAFSHLLGHLVGSNEPILAAVMENYFALIVSYGDWVVKESYVDISIQFRLI